MLINEISLENFRSYKDRVPISNLSNVNAFIGPNGAGKSNVLEALKYVKGLLGENQTRPFVEMVFDHDTNQTIVIEIHFKTDSDFRSKTIDKLFEQNKQVNLENIRKSAFLSEIIFRIGIANDGVEHEEIQISQSNGKPVAIFRGILEGKNVRFDSIQLEKKCFMISEPYIPAADYQNIGSMNRIWAILRGIGGLSPIEQAILNATRKSIMSWGWLEPTRRAQRRMPLGEESRLDPTGSNLAKFLNSILGKDPDEFVLLKNKVAETLPIIDRILAPPRGGEATVDIREKGLRRPIDLGNVSLGFMQTLILIIGIATEDERNLIMIEEPELHLHADAQRRLFEFIQRQSERNQFFLTTHSTVFTGCSDKICTYLTTKKHGKTSVKKVKEAVELRVLKGLLGYRNTDFYGDECVVFIEGDSEEIALPIIADALELGLVERGIRLVNVRGGKRAAKIKEYLNYLNNSGVMSYVIADGDKTVRSKLEDWQREGVVEKDCWTVWDLEFEDCFSLDMVVAAFNELMQDQEAQLKVTAYQLKKKMKRGESVVRVLERVLHQNNLPNLDKPSLAEKLAYLLSEDIKKNKHEETVVEKELKKIAELVELRGKVTS